MSAELLPVWNEIEKYIDAGISVIPVRDTNSAQGVAKSPYGNWKACQITPLTKQELFDQMDVKYNTTAVGIIGGKVSGNLEIIDIDVKYKHGIDATLFTDLKTLYPDLLKKVRIHKTPSGGFHILYRCSDPVEGNQKLAGRDKTPEELSVEPRPKTVNFLETRGEGGYVVAPPALGYTVVKGNPIPILSKTERDSIISLCRSYNEIITPEKAPYKPTKTEDAYYDTNPFEDFNNRVDPSALVSEFGWKEFKHNNHFIWYTRPGKVKGVSMSFNQQKRFFFCFTASTELEENKGYSPANLLALLAHGGDKKRLYSDLVSRGYGRIKPKVEQRLAKTAAINGKPLPTNASQEALAARAQLEATIDELHPFGTFWIDSMEHGIQIDRELLYRVASGLGFMLWHNHLVRSDGKFIEEVEDRFFFDTLKAYVHEEDADLYKDICNAFESFIEKHGKFTITRLPILPDTAILADTKDEAFKCYQNGILRITADSINLYPSTPNGLLIWKHALQPREFFHSTRGRYIEFLKLATDFDSNKEYLLSCIGYLAHEYKDETTGYIVVLTEQCENPKDGGGAGKNVFSNLFRHTTSFTGKPGEQIKYDEKFMQSWNYQKIFCISDAPKNFNFSFLKELSTGTGLMKKLFKDETEIPTELMPKFLVQTNYSIEIKDGGLKRRVKIIEFTDFFTKVGGIDVHFDVHFPNEWNQEDWNGYDTLMAIAVQLWLKGGRKIGASTLSTGGWMKQFEQSYGAVAAGFIKEHIDHWVQSGYVTNELFKEEFERFCVENNTPHHYRPSMNKINDAIVEWCKQHDLQYMNQLVYRDMMGSKKRKWFGRREDVPF